MTWKNFYSPANDKERLRNYMNGTLSCFCEDQYSNQGFWAMNKYYRGDGLDQLPNVLYDEILSNEGESNIDP